MSDTNYDVIVIGSGMGGLTAASLLAQLEGKRVLVLEKHWIIGGQTHEFKRKKWTWDVGVHYIGGMTKRHMGSQIFQLATGGKVEWCSMPHDFERFIYPEVELSVPADKNEYIARLITLFPKEEANIRAYFDDIKAAGKEFSRNMALGALPAWLRWPTRVLAQKFGTYLTMTTGEYMEQRFRDPVLRTLLCSQWGDYGVPPSMSLFGMHALVVMHYIKGGQFPVGGASSIAEAIVPIIEEAGGQCLTRRTVKSLIRDGDRAVGVRVERMYKGKPVQEEYRAPVVISAIGLYNTVEHLSDDPCFDRLRAQLKTLPTPPSAVTVYLGLNESPEKLGVKGENYWIYDTMSHEEAYRQDLTQESAKLAYLSFPSMKNPEAKAHTAEIVSLMNMPHFDKWKGTKWKKRGEDYEFAKSHVEKSLLELVGKVHPGMKDLVAYSEVSTPLTMLEFTNWTQGGFDGLPMVKERFNLDQLGVFTPIKGFYMSGTDVASPGVVGAMMGGMATAAVIMGLRGFPRIQEAAGAMPMPTVHPPVVTSSVPSPKKKSA